MLLSVEFNTNYISQTLLAWIGKGQSHMDEVSVLHCACLPTKATNTGSNVAAAE